MTKRWAPPRATATGLGLVAEIAAVLFTVALRWWVTRDRLVYSGTSDEASHLGIARTLSGARPFHLVDGQGVDPAFGTLIAPIYAVVEDPEVAFRLVLATNVVIAVLTVLVLRALLMRVLDVDGPVAAWSAAIALALPGAAMQTPFTGSEVFIVFMISLTVLLAVMVTEDGTRWPALGLAAAGASMLVVHSRLTLVVPAVLVILVVEHWTGAIDRPTTGVAVVLLVVSSWLALEYNDWVYDLVWLPSVPGPSQVSDGIARLRQPLAVVASAAGMVWHQLVTTFGLVIVGIGHLVATAVRRGGSLREGMRGRPGWKILVILVTAAVPAAVFMADRRLATQMVYGRYWDPLAVPVVTIGVGYLLRVGYRRASRAFSTAILVTGATGVAFFLARQNALTASFEEYGFRNPRRVAGLLAFVSPDRVINVAVVTVMALAAMAAVSAVIVVARRHHRLATAVVLVGVATAATARASIHLNEQDIAYARWRPAMELVEDGIVPDDATVAFQLDDSHYDRLNPKFPFTAYQFYEPDVEFVGLDGPAVLDYDWVVSDDTDPLLEEQDWEVVFEHPDGRELAVWRKP